MNKIRPWGQGPVFLQSLALLKGFDIGAMGPTSATFIHTVVEAMKLAFADREAYYGDPDFVDVPIDTLLSDAYSNERRKLIGEQASRELRPGHVNGFERQVERTLEVLRDLSTMDREITGGEPTMASMRSARRGDTVHIDVIDRHRQHDRRDAVRRLAAIVTRHPGTRLHAQLACADVLA